MPGCEEQKCTVQKLFSRVVTVKLRKPWTLELSLGCYCVGKDNQSETRWMNHKPVMVINVVVCGFFLWFDLASDW